MAGVRLAGVVRYCEDEAVEIATYLQQRFLSWLASRYLPVKVEAAVKGGRVTARCASVEEAQALIEALSDEQARDHDYPVLAHLTFFPSACGHPQVSPTSHEIEKCADVIVRRCAECHVELYWTMNRWRTAA